MKKPAKITYLVNRIAILLVLTISLVGFFLADGAENKSIYLFNAFQCVLFLIISFTPNFFKKMRFEIPDVFYVVFLIFCVAHFFLGEILDFYALVFWWDSALHTLSGVLLTFVSFSFVNLLNETNEKGFKMSVLFAVIMAFCFTMTIGVMWEVVEFSIDRIFATNMQRAYASTVTGSRGAPLLGEAALMDTMKDLLLDALGSIIVCVICAIVFTKKKISVEKLGFFKMSKKEVKANKKAKKSKLDQQPSTENNKIEAEENINKENNNKEQVE